MRALVAALALAACGPSATPPPVTGGSSEDSAPVESERPVLEDGAPVESEATVAVAATGATEAEATEAARALLRARVLGAWGGDAGLVLIDPAAIEVAATDDGGFEARIALDEARVQAVLDALPERLPRPAFGGAYGERLGPLQEAALANLVCERRRALLAAPEVEGEAQADAGAPAGCELADLEPLLREAAAAVRSLILTPVWRGGVPVGEGGRPLRKPAVRLVSGDAPVSGLAGLPLIARSEGEGEADRATVDAEGLAVFRADPTGGLIVTLDRARLLPPLDALFPELRTTLETRPVGLRRWALVVTEDRVSSPGAADAFADTLGQTLRSAGTHPPVELDRDARRAIEAANGSARATTLRALAEAQRGQLDVVLIATVESHFASRMGTRRVWYEATASVTARLAWTGEVLTTATATATKSGIGEERAEAAARREVARDIARQLTAAAPLPQLAHR